MIQPTHLRFGIPSLDVLIGSPAPVKNSKYKKTNQLGIFLESERDRGSSLTICIAGAAGVGKSILALHLASRYATDTVHLNGDKAPHVFYASTDLSEAQANRQWAGFGLNATVGPSFERHKGVEREPFWGFDDPYQEPDYYPALRAKENTVALNVITPDDLPALDLDAAPAEPIVHFLDLQRTTAGDDWQYLNNLLGQLPDRKNSPSKHLLIIDAVEGLEALTGTEDAFGQFRSRRSRITQIIRNASKKCHLLFIIEGGVEVDLPEQFAADVVLRLRNSLSREGYLRRTIEVEKARGQSHVRGQHLIHFRRGNAGSTTGQQKNADDPEVKSSYVYVVPSLDLVERTIMRMRGKGLPEPNKAVVAEFGIRYLDNMLRLPQPPSDDHRDRRGLPSGSVTALTGDDGTQKSRLVRAFLARNFIDLAKNDRIYELLRTASGANKETVAREIERIMQEEILVRAPYSLFFTTSDIDVEGVTENIVKIITRNGRRWKNYLPKPSASKDQNKVNNSLIKDLTTTLKLLIMERVACRRLERHNISPAQLFHIIRSNVRHAQIETTKLINVQRQQNGKSSLHFADSDVRKKESGYRIRVAIEDWQIIRDNYPEVREDNRFLGFLLFYLAREGVTTLVAQTAPGQPEAMLEQDENRLQKEAHFNIRTWRIRFGDIDRVAITAIPPIATDRPSQIRELTWETEDIDSSLTVDPILELFQGLREGNPRLSPLRIRLNSESPEMVQFAARVQQLLLEKYPGAQPADIKVLCSGIDAGGAAESYEALRDLCHLREELPIDHALVFMVDEFWSVADVKNRSTLGRMSEYLSETTWRNQEQERFSDPDGIFQPNRLEHFERPTEPLKRLDFFASPNAELDTQTRTERRNSESLSSELAQKTGRRKSDYPATSLHDIDRVPFLQNFGFLLCQERAWDSARRLPLTAIARSDGKPIRVDQVWTELKRVSAFPKGNVTPEDSTRGTAPIENGVLSWRTFLEACVVVSQDWSTREYPVSAFELSRHSTESISCLFLEVWASEIYADLLGSDPNRAKSFAKNLSTRRWRQTPDDQKHPSESLVKWLTDNAWVNPESLTLDQPGGFHQRLAQGKDLPGFTHALYRTLLIMAEVLTWDSLSRQENVFGKKDPPSQHRNRAVASRVWYTTAAPIQGVLEDFRLPQNDQLPTFDEKDPLVMMELPGAFSTRGDWFLSVSPGSSSQRLAERAVDLMSSFTSNLTRLEIGAGLPVRDLERYRTIRTPLVTYKWDETGQVSHFGPALYRDVMELHPKRSDPGYHCLWRSSLYDYDRQARVLQRWIIRELQYLIRLRQYREHEWKSGFFIYDQLMAGFDPKKPSLYRADETPLGEEHPGERPGDLSTFLPYYKLDSWKRFADRCTRLVGFLMGSSRWHDGESDPVEHD